MPYDDGGHYYVDPDNCRYDTLKEYQVDQDIDNGVLDTKDSEPFWFDKTADQDARDLQIDLGVLFNATIRWFEDDKIEHVVMATYDTEGMPEDDQVFFSWGSYATQAELVQDMKNDNDDEWIVIDCDLY